MTIEEFEAHKAKCKERDVREARKLRLQHLSISAGSKVPVIGLIILVMVAIMN